MAAKDKVNTVCIAFLHAASVAADPELVLDVHATQAAALCVGLAVAALVAAACAAGDATMVTAGHVACCGGGRQVELWVHVAPAGGTVGTGHRQEARASVSNHCELLGRRASKHVRVVVPGERRGEEG